MLLVGVFMLACMTCLFFMNSFSGLVIAASLKLLSLGKFSLEVAFLWDWMGVFLLLTVGVISSLVICYSSSYLSLDFRLYRFWLVLASFVASMLCLAVATSWVSIFLGWEGLGFSSYFLVLYYSSQVASSGSFMTAYMNRVGDFSLLVCLALVSSLGSSLLGSWYNEADFLAFFVGALLLVSVSCKSAQFPFMAWLPAAMAAPTPVSALVHSSTLVAAGVYLGIRSVSLFSPSLLMGLGVLASWSIVLSSISAVFCMDGKKVVALSTLSQISIVGALLSMGMPSMAFFHLVAHAYVKSYLFMSLGFVLHSSSSAQDFRSLSSMSSGYFSSLHIGVSLMALSSLPFLTIYFSKEVLVLSSMQAGLASVSSLVLIMGSGFTLLYSLRLALWLFNSAPCSMSLSLKDFNVGTVLITGFFSSILLGTSLSCLMGSFLMFVSAKGPLFLLGVLVALVGISLVMSFSDPLKGPKSLESGLYIFSSSGALFSSFTEKMKTMNSLLDLGYMEFSSPEWAASMAQSTSSVFQSLSSSYSTFFVGSLTLGLMVLVLF